MPLLRPHLSAIVVGLMALTVCIYWPSSAALWHYWTWSYDGTQGLLVVAIAMVLLYRSRDRITRAPVEPLPWALAALLLCSAASLVFWRAGIQELHLLLLPVLLLLAVLAAFGSGVARAVAFPIGYLYFAMPVWNSLAAPLKSLTLWVTAAGAPLLGMPATVTGSFVSFPNGATFEVVKECGGSVFLLQGLAVAALLGELEHAPLSRRVKLLASMVAVALVANWVRVFALLYLGYTSQMRNILVSRDHLLFGWLVFAVVLVGWVWLASRTAPRTAESLGAESDPAAGQVHPRAIAVAAIALAALPIFVYSVALPADARAASATLHLPGTGGGWSGPSALSASSWDPTFVGPHAQWKFQYTDTTGRVVEALAVAYATQGQGHELVNDGNSLLGDRNFSLLSSGVVDNHGQQYFEETVVNGQGSKTLLWLVYAIGPRTFVTPLFSQLWYGLRALTSPPYSVLYAFKAPCRVSCEEARQTLESFTRAMGPGLIAAVAAAAPKDLS